MEKKLTELTSEQESLMYKVRDEWIDLFFNNVKDQRGIDKPRFEEGITWLYTDLLKKPAPRIVYCDSWLSCIMTISILKKFDQASDSVSTSVKDSVWASVMASVWDSVWDSVMTSVWDSVMTTYNQYSYYVRADDYGWVAFYDFFEKTGILNHEPFRKYKDLIKSGVLVTYMYENIVFAVQPPVYIERNASGRLHSTDTAAVQFRDGSKYYFINGRSVPAWLIEGKGTITRQRFIEEKNAEIKGAIYESLGQQGMMNLLGATVVDVKQIRHANGEDETVELLKTRDTFPEIENHPFAWVKVICPSTGTNYLLGVEAHHVDAKEALVSLSMFDKKDYSFNYRT